MQEFLNREWQELGSRTIQTAEHFSARAENDGADFVSAAEAFASQNPPAKYDELLDRCREASELAVNWKQTVAADSEPDSN